MLTRVSHLSFEQPKNVPIPVAIENKRKWIWHGNNDQWIRQHDTLSNGKVQHHYVSKLSVMRVVCISDINTQNNYQYQFAIVVVI